MKKLLVLCVLMIAVAVCRNNQVMGSTPGGSDTLFMRFENYRYYENRSTNFDSGVVFLWFVEAGKQLAVVVEIETDRGKSVQRRRLSCSTVTGSPSYKSAYSMRFDSLIGRNFTVKIYDDPDWIGDFQLRDINSFTLHGSATQLSFYHCDSLRSIYVDKGPWGDYHYHSSLRSLTISECPRLGWVECDNNQLESLDVNGCTALRFLGCRFNQLSSLDVSGCAALEGLNCDNNQLESLDVSGCMALEWLHCYNNRLSSLDVSGCTALDGLRCYNNQLESLDVSGCAALESLHCDNNQLESLDVSGCMALQSLECDNNRLELLDVGGCTALQSLECDNNRLGSLDVGGCAALKYLHCGNNQLSSLDVGGFTALEYLECDNNQLGTLDVGGCTALRSLDCSNNQLESLDLYDISNMYRCLIFGNRLSEVFYTGKKMDDIAFGDNGLPLHKCFELSKFWSGYTCGVLQGNSQHIPVSLAISENYDLHADMELDGEETTLRVTRKGGGYLAPELYSIENDLLSFAEKGEYTVEMANPKVREYIREDCNSFGWSSSTDLISVYLDVCVEMPDDPNNPNDPGTDDPNTANEALGLLTSPALRVYPNPATDVLRVELQENAEANATTALETLRTVRILSLSGHLYYSFGSGFDNLPVGNLPAGLYLLEAETSTGAVLRQKFVKR